MNELLSNQKKLRLVRNYLTEISRIFATQRWDKMEDVLIRLTGIVRMWKREEQERVDDQRSF